MCAMNEVDAGRYQRISARRYSRKEETEEGVDCSLSEEKDQRATDVVKLWTLE